MPVKYYSLRLLPPRPSFAQDMSAEEKAIMQKHSAYWRELMQQGKVIVFGPVLDPKGVYGLGIIAANDDEEVKAFMAGDPANGLNRYEWHPMLAVVPEK
ncbi:MAG: YciI family protein [Bacteroidota bacterium]|nr:YciI family protein [Bacteroidota bacterium]